MQQQSYLFYFSSITEFIAWKKPEAVKTDQHRRAGFRVLHQRRIVVPMPGFSDSRDEHLGRLSGSDSVLNDVTRRNVLNERRAVKIGSR